MPGQYSDFPLVSGEILRVLQAGLGAPAAYREYVLRYLEMWPGRYGLLVAALRSGDEKAAMDAVLSVKSSSQMLGALWLARMVLGVETAVLERRMDAARAMMDEVELCGRRTAEQLRQDLGE